jgi:exosortase/archaeosortase family protein
MNLLLALLAVGAACWHGWLGLAERIDGLGAALPLLLVGGALALPCLLRSRPLRPVPLWPMASLLAAYGVAVLLAPPVFCIAPAVLAAGYALFTASHDSPPQASFIGLILLALPVLPTLEFYAAYPVRLAAIEATASLLRMNGLAVRVEGLALDHDGQLIQFDAPCSGVRMLWTCWFLASALAHLYQFRWWLYARALALATLLAVCGNILRASSLFYLEAGLLPFEAWQGMHDAVGVAAFSMTSLLLFWLLRPGTRTKRGDATTVAAA